MVGETTSGNSSGDIGVELINAELTPDDNSPDRSEDDGPTGIPTVDPQAYIIEPEQPTGKRRGRKPGSKNRVQQQPTKEVSQDLTTILWSAHFMLAKLIHVSELELTKDEAEELGKAVARVNKEFGVQIMSPKTAALVNLGFVGAGIYGTRAMTIINNAKNKKKPKAAPVAPIAEWPTVGQV